MDVPTLMHNLKEEVTCSVCMQLYKKPKQLPCLHMFCLHCLNDLARTSAHNGKIRCPLCQREVAVPESGTLETLPNCFHMKNLLDILAIKECNTAKVTCGNCEKKSEEASYCFHCGKFWCNDCVNAHNILRENKEHRVLDLKDFEDKDFEDVLKRPVFCQKELHDKEVLKFYCKECDIPVCQTCVIVEHNKHDVEHLELAAREVKTSITSKLAAARETSNALSFKYTGDKEEKSRLIEFCSKSNKKRIQQMVKSLISILQQKEQELIAEVENQRQMAQEELGKSADVFQDFLSKREASISNIEALVERSTGAELVRTKATVDTLFQGLQEPQDMPSTTERKVHFTVFVKNEAISRDLEESVIGRLEQSATEANQCLVNEFRTATAGLATEIEVITRNSDGEQCYCSGDFITVQLISAQQDFNVNYIAKEVEIVDGKNGRYTVSFIPSKSGQHLLVVQVNGENIKEFPPVEIKERCFNPLRLIGERTIEGIQLDKPWGVTVNDSNEIFVSDMNNNRIVVFNENGEFIRSFGQNALNCPNGVIADNTGKIFVGNRLDNKILVFGQNGEYLSTFYDGKSLRQPRGISVDTKGNIIVCDSGNKCVRFFSPDGKIFKTTGAGRGRGVRMPFNCVCQEGKVFVSDREAHQIKVYNSNGRFLYEFGEPGTGDGELNYPIGLAVDKTGHLLVSSLHNHRVQVFTIDGKFVAKFGEFGQNLGQMNSPSSVAVLKSGRIVVCEFDNKRLQVFE